MPDPQTVNVTGPDGKKYKFPAGTTKDKAINYFKKKGITAPKKDDKSADPYGMGTSKFLSGKENVDVLKGKSEVRNEQADADARKGRSAAIDYTSKELPATGGMVGGEVGAIGGPQGARVGSGLGQAAGEAANQLIQRFAFSRDPEGNPLGSKTDTSFNAAKNIVQEAAKGYALQYVGEKTGTAFFKLLSKIPHAKIVDGIPLLPGETASGGKISKYVEDLLSNLIPSAKTMADFRSKQGEAIEKATTMLADGFSKFKGTSEQMGELLQNAMYSAERLAKKQVMAIKKAGNLTDKQLWNTPEYKEFSKNFKNELVQKIINTNKPELIAGLLKSKDAALGETRNLASYLAENKPQILGKVQSRILRDSIAEVLKGSKDATLKGGANQQFVGKTFKNVMDSIGEERLKAIYGQEGYDSIENFIQTTQRIGGSGSSGVGKFMNLIFALGPIRSGLTAKTMGTIVKEGFIFNRAAKVITSTEGMRLYENFIRASSIRSVKAVSAARDALIKFNERSDLEYESERQEAIEQYKKAHPGWKPSSEN